MIGAGAAGLVAAIAAAGGPAPVVLLERTADGGRKILISGGGRCNVLPSALAPERFVTDSPTHLMRGMLRAWPLPLMVRFFEEELGVPLALEAGTGKFFPRSNRARDVRDGLVAHAGRRGVRFQFNTRVAGLAPSAAGWQIDTSQGPIRASRVILATGGLSVPATGSDGLGLTLARTLGHRIHDTYAALTPLTFDPVAPRTPHPALRTAPGTPHTAPGTALCTAPRTPHPAPGTALCTLHAAPGTPRRHLPPRAPPCACWRTNGRGHRGLPVHASWLQRAGRARHLARVRPERGRRSRAGTRGLEPDPGDGVGRAPSGRRPERGDGRVE